MLAAVDHYPEWCPDVLRSVEVLDRNAEGQPRRVRMTIRVAWATLVREFQLFLAIAVEPLQAVVLTRVTDHPTNQEFTAKWMLWRDPISRIDLHLDAKLRVPPYVPAAGVADEIAGGFVTAASRALAARSNQAASRSDETTQSGSEIRSR
jgi:hypothetical protein